MSVFIRRFLSDPGNAVLTNIEAVDILDLDPPASISGVGTGTACMVGEFENGPFNTPTEVSGAADLLNTFGGFGYVYSGVKGNNPSARTRNADTLGAETWNGNGFVQLAGKKFSRLILVRADTSVGSVAFSPLAAIYSTIQAPTVTFASSKTLIFTIAGGGAVTATFPAATYTAATLAAIVTVADASASVRLSADGYLTLVNTAGTALAITGGTALTGLGMSVSSATASSAGATLPAGTVVTTTGATLSWVTMQDVVFLADATASQSVKVRPATDDGTSTLSAIGTAAVVSTSSTLGQFGVTNAVALTAALTEAAIDAAYQTAVDSTLDLNGVSHDINLAWSARQSAAMRLATRANVIDASANGLFGRMGAIRPPLNTTRTNARASTGVGVGVTRDQRVVYCYPGLQVYLPTIASVGISGGTGFTATGLVDAGSDGLMVSILSQLPPEENPGQATTFTAAVVGMESGSNAQGFLMTDYINFRAAGIAAPRIDGGVVIFQSGVTSVDPLVNPQQRNIARRRMADFIQDTLAMRLKSFGKKLNSFSRRKAIASEIRIFMNSLKSDNNPSSARIEDYLLDEKSGNTAASSALGIFRLILKVRTLSSLDAIVLQTEIGESVTVSEAA